MNWFPSFLNPWPALLAAAVAVPLLVLLYFLKLRRREMPVASTLLWKKAVQDLQVNAPFQRLRRNLLLLLQLLALAGLLLAIARPAAPLAPRAGLATVLLIDRSASMAADDADGSTRLERAKSRARDLIATLPSGGSAMVIAFDDRAEVMAPFTSDAQSLRAAVDAIGQTDRRTSLRQAYQLAEAQSAAFIPEQLRSSAVRPDVWLLSDGRANDSGELSLGAELHFDPIGAGDIADAEGNLVTPAPTRNVAIVSLSARRNYQRPTEVQVFARLASFGPDVEEVPVQMSVSRGSGDPEFRVQGSATATLAPDRWTADQRRLAAADGVMIRQGVEFTLELTDEAVIRVQLRPGEPDSLSADDSAAVVVPKPRSVRLVHVTDGANPFMTKVLESLGLTDIAALTPASYEAALPDADIVLFDRYSPKSLAASGNFIYFAAVPPDLDLAATDQGKRVLDRDVSVIDWDREHPVLQGLLLGRIFAAESLRLQPPLDAQVIIEGTLGPLMVRLQQGRQTHVVVGFDTLQSNWPTRPSFPVFMLNLVQYLALGTEMTARDAFAPGDTPVIPRTAIDRVDPNLRSFRLIGPDGPTQVEVRESAEVVLPSLDRVGVYRTDPPIPRFEQIAVNLTDANESDLVPARTAPGGIGEVVQTAAGPARTELWRWILGFVVIPLLLIEWWVYTRRVHL